MPNTTDTAYWIGGAALTVLTGGLLLLPLGLALFWTVCQRREELRKGELEDAKRF